MGDLVRSHPAPAVRAAALSMITTWCGPSIFGLAQVAREDPADIVRQTATAILNSSGLPASPASPASPAAPAKAPPLSGPPTAASTAAGPQAFSPAPTLAIAAGAPPHATRPPTAAATHLQAVTQSVQQVHVGMPSSASTEAAASATVVPGTSEPPSDDKLNADLAQAILLSKTEIPEMLSDDGVVLLRLDRHARASEVTTVLLKAACLEACRASVSEAQCELRPSWAGGAWILFPMTQPMFEEAGLDTVTSAFHILALSKDEAALQQALKAVPKPKRPLLRKVRLGSASIHGPQCGDIGAPLANPTGVSSRGQTASPTEPLHSEASDEERLCELVVERTFFTMRPIADDGTASLRSAPALLQRNAA